MTLTVDAVAGYAYAAGLRGEALVTAVAIAGRESGYDPSVLNDNAKTHDLSYGLWQINMRGDLGPARRKQLGLSRNEQLLDPATNARAMYTISGGGSNFKPWTTYKDHTLDKFIGPARSASQAVEARHGAGTPSGGAASTIENSPRSSATSAPAEVVIAGETIPPGGGLAEIAAGTSLFPELTFAAPRGRPVVLGRLGLDGSVALSVNAISEVTMSYADPRGVAQSGSRFQAFDTATLADLVLMVTDTTWEDRDGVEGFSVTLQGAGAARMNRLRTGEDWSNLSPTQVMRIIATETGMRFYGKGTAIRERIVQLDGNNTTTDSTDTDSSTSTATTSSGPGESQWELGQRLAREEGFWIFETANALYFAPPTWLVEHGIRFPVEWTLANSHYRTIGLPTCRTTITEVKKTPTPTRSIEAHLPRWRGEQVRPGMVMMYSGTPGYEANLGQPIPFVVTDVSWPLDGGVEPVVVTAIEAIDPEPEPPENDSTSGGELDPVTGNSGTPTETGNVSGGGKGSYGYQYDGPGTVPAKGPQPGNVALMKHLLAKFPTCTNAGIFVARTVDGTSKLSAHAEGRADDVHVPVVSGTVGDQVARYCVANAPLFGVQYIIWNAQSWNATRRAWKPYQHPNGKTDNTSLHRDHVHVELCWEAAHNLTAAQMTGAVNP